MIDNYRCKLGGCLALINYVNTHCFLYFKSSKIFNHITYVPIPMQIIYLGYIK